MYLKSRKTKRTIKSADHATNENENKNNLVIFKMMGEGRDFSFST